jgi:LEA14-like dessication related protein
MKRIALLSTLIVSVAAAGCYSALNLVNPEYAIRDVQPRVQVAIPFSASIVELDFDIEIRNPNSVGLRVDQIDFDLLLNSQRVLSGISNQNVRIPANGIGMVELRTRFGYDNAQTFFREAIDWVQGGRANYELRGTVHYNTPIGRMSFPLTVYRRSR